MAQIQQGTTGRVRYPMEVIWVGAFVFVAIVGGFMTPWDAITHVIENQGVGDDGASVLGFVAGLTFPLALAAMVLSLLAIHGAHKDATPFATGAVITAVLVAAGLLAEAIGLGQLPEYSMTPIGGPPYVAYPLMALRGYVNAYGTALTLSSVVVGVAAALQLESWRQKVVSPEA